MFSEAWGQGQEQLITIWGVATGVRRLVLLPITNITDRLNIHVHVSKISSKVNIKPFTPLEGVELSRIAFT